MRSVFLALAAAIVSFGVVACEQEGREAATPTPTPSAVVHETPSTQGTLTPEATPAAERTPTPQPTPTPTPDITELQQAMTACSGHTWGTTEQEHLDWSLAPEAMSQQDYTSILEERKATLDNWESNLTVVNEYLLQRVSEAERVELIGPIIDKGPPHAECLRKVLLGEEPPAPPAGGTSRTNPVPLGDTASVPPGWEVTVIGVNPDAWPVIQAENMFNAPPEEGYRMLLITVRVTNVQAGDEPDIIGEGDFELVGSRGQVYKTYERSCGVTPNELSAELFPGGTADGTVCFQAGTDETDLVLIADIGFSFTEETRRYFALE
jgi:hypothetical protein